MNWDAGYWTVSPVYNVLIEIIKSNVELAMYLLIMCEVLPWKTSVQLVCAQEDKKYNICSKDLKQTL